MVKNYSLSIENLPDHLREEFEILCELGVEAHEAEYLIKLKNS